MKTACFVAATVVLASMVTFSATAQPAPVEAEANVVITRMNTPVLGIRGIPPQGGMQGFFTSEPAAMDIFRYQLPDFDPADLDTHLYHVSFFSENGNGSGTANADYDGLIEAEVPQAHPVMVNGELHTEAWKIYLHALDKASGEVEIFLDLYDMTLNDAVNILNNVRRSADMQMAMSQGNASLDIFHQRPQMPNPAHDAIHLNLYGDYLTLDEVQEQIFQATRCDVALQDEIFVVASCD